MSANLSDNACYAPLFADAEVAALFGTEATIAGILRYEAALARALGNCGVAPKAAVDAAIKAIEKWEPDFTALTADFRADGLPVPAVVRALKAQGGAEAAPALHVAATSQDVLDTGQAFALHALSDLVAGRLAEVIDALDRLDATFGREKLMGRTRMQAALPIPASHRIAEWKLCVGRALARLPEARRGVEQVSYSGPVGLRDGPKGDAVAANLADLLGLPLAERGSHVARDGVVAYGGFLSIVAGAAGKIGTDVSLMAQQGVGEAGLSGGGSSSAMPHKQNPVLAETLISQARFVAAQQGGLTGALIHEQERSGAAWALEWMFLPLMAETTGAALNNLRHLLDQINRIGPAD